MFPISFYPLSPIQTHPHPITPSSIWPRSISQHSLIKIHPRTRPVYLLIPWELPWQSSCYPHNPLSHIPNPKYPTPIPHPYPHPLPFLHHRTTKPLISFILNPPSKPWTSYLYPIPEYFPYHPYSINLISPSSHIPANLNPQPFALHSLSYPPPS